MGTVPAWAIAAAKISPARTPEPLANRTRWGGQDREHPINAGILTWARTRIRLLFSLWRIASWNGPCSPAMYANARFGRKLAHEGFGRGDGEPGQEPGGRMKEPWGMLS
jgi:hypothetical protein